MANLDAEFLVLAISWKIDAQKVRWGTLVKSTMIIENVSLCLSKELFKSTGLLQGVTIQFLFLADATDHTVKM